MVKLRIYFTISLINSYQDQQNWGQMPPIHQIYRFWLQIIHNPSIKLLTNHETLTLISIAPIGRRQRGRKIIHQKALFAQRWRWLRSLSLSAELFRWSVGACRFGDLGGSFLGFLGPKLRGVVAKTPEFPGSRLLELRFLDSFLNKNLCTWPFDVELGGTASRFPA